MSMRFLTLDVGGTYAVTPSHVNTPQDFTCQLVAHYNQINELTTELSLFHEVLLPTVEGNLPHDYLVPGSVGCVKSKNGKWYRAVLVSLPRNDMIQAKFLDYGTLEEVHVSNLKQISKQEFVDIPIQGLEFKLWNVKPLGLSWSESENNFFQNMVLGKEFVVKVINVTPERHFEVSMLDHDRLEINRHFKGMTSSSNNAVSPPPIGMQRQPILHNSQRNVRGQGIASGLLPRNQQPPSKVLSHNANQVLSLKNQVLKVGSSSVVTVAVINSFTDVVCHVTQNIPMLDALMSDIDQFYSALMPNDLALGGVVPGMACCARYTNNNNWYRAEIVSMQGRGIEVEYVDYGNREVLPISRLKKISTAFMSVPKQGVHCTLVEAENSLNYSQDALVMFKRQVNQNLSAQVMKEVQPGKYFIILSDNVGQNLLSRLMIPSCAGDAGQNVPTIPSIRLNPGQQISVEVTSVVSVSRFTCQLKNSTAELDAMMDKMHSYYTTNSSNISLTNSSRGMHCCCQFTEDDGWYRAEITNLNGGEAEVKYVDYGNSERLPLNRIKDLQLEFITLPKQSIDCCVDVAFNEANIESLTSKFESLTQEKNLTAIVLQTEADGRFRLKLIDGSSDIGLQLLQSQEPQKQLPRGQTKSTHHALLQQQISNSFNYPKSTLQIGVEQKVYVSHVDNPECFYVQLSDSAEKMDEIVDAIHDHYSKLGPNDETCIPELGMPCITKYTADNGWYRAKITGMYHNGDVQVIFVDYGNIEVLKGSKLKELHKDFMLLPSQGIKCALMGIQSGGQEWSGDITYGFEELVLNKELSINALQYNTKSDLYQVQLFDSDRSNLSVKLLKMAGSGAAGVATNPYDVITFTKGQYENVMISHSEDPGNFWCHISEKIPEIDALMDDLFEAYDSNSSQSLGSKAKAGLTCCAKYTDESWYRAKILKVKGQDASIQFVDYGNISLVKTSDLKPLQHKFENLPEQAIACSLVDIAPIGASWSEQSVTVFNEMVIDKKLVLHVISQEESGRSLVELVNTQEDKVINEAMVNKGLAKSTKSSYSSKSSRSSSRVSSKGRQLIRNNSQDSLIQGNLSNSGSTTSLPSLVVLGFKDASYRPGCKLPVYISHACSPAEFWCQSVETSGMLDELMNKIDQHYSKLERSEHSLDTTTVGTPCIAKYTADEGWYRGIIVNKHMGCLEINFVDYGNTERVSVTDVKQILPEFLELPIQGLKCVVKGMQTKGTSKSMVKQFADVASGIEQFSCSILTESSGVYEVDLEWNGKKMSSELASSKNKKERSNSQRSNISDDVFGMPAIKGNQNARLTPPQKDSVDSGRLSVPSNRTTNFGSPGRGGFGQKPDRIESKQRREPSLSYVIDSVGVGGYEDVVVSHIENPNQFWCQPAKSCAELDQLMDLLNQDEHLPIDDVRSGSPCLARFRDDDSLYRAVIKRQLPNSKVDIQFIDYGNSDTVSVKDLKIIKPSFTTLPAQAIECRIKGLQTEASILTDDFEGLVAEKQLVAYISGKKDKILEIVLTDTSGGKDTMIADQLNLKAANKPMKFTPLNIKVGDKEDIYITCTDNGGVIYAQFGSQASLLEEIQNRLQSYYTSTKSENLSCFNVKKNCCALFKDDEMWYRATIEGHGENGKVLVRYTDFGNTEVQEKSTLKDLIHAVADVPPLALKCIINVDNANKWNHDTNQKFSEMVTDKLLKAEFLSDSVPYTVKLTLDGGDVGDLFRSKVVDFPPEVPLKFKSNHNLLKDKIEVYVCHTVSLDQFWCQPASSADDLSEIMNSIHEVYSCLGQKERAVQEFTVNTPCVAKFADDDGWYRGLIAGSSDEGVHVMYVDYGNSAVVSATDIKTITQEFMSLPPQAVCCQLKGGQNWKEGAVEKFEEETTDKKLLAEVVGKKLVESDMVIRVNLLDMGVSVLQKLLDAELGEVPDEEEVEPLLFYKSSLTLVQANELLEVYVSSVNSIDDFNVQLNKTANELSTVMDTIFEIYSSDNIENAPHVQGPCIAKYAEDGGWYRGEVTEVASETGLVFFVDYGNSEHVPWTDIKRTCIEATVLPAQAVKCKLSLPENMNSMKEELIFKFQEAISDKLLTAEFLVSTDDVWEVKLREDGQLVADNLVKNVAPNQVEAAPSQTYKSLCFKEGDEKRVVVCWSESPGEFWCQVESRDADLNALSDDIQAHYATLGEDSEIMAQQRVGMPCVAPVEEEGVWYRAIITNCSEDQTTIRYVDYGNTAILQKSKVKTIQESLLSQPVFAFRSSLAGVSPKDNIWSAEACEAFANLAFEGVLTASVTKVIDDTHSCSLKLVDDNGVSLNQSLLDSAVAVATADDPVVNTKCTADTKLPQYIQMPIPIEPEIELQISHVETPHKFFIQPTSNAEELEQISAKVMNIVPSASPIEQVRVGDVCLAKYSLDEVWYRAVIDGTEDTLIYVTFIDYGNTDALQLSDLKQIPAELCSLPAQALECRLSSVAPLGESWEDSASVAFEETVIEQLYNATFSGQSVELYTKEGTPLKDILIEAGICKLSNVPSEEEDVAAVQRPLSDHEERLNEIAIIAKVVVEDVIKGALEYLKDECLDPSNSSDDQDIQRDSTEIKEFYSQQNKSEVISETNLAKALFNNSAVDNDKATTEQLTTEPSTGKQIIAPATVEKILDDIVEASVNQAVESTRIFDDASIIDAVSEVANTDEVVNTCDVASTGVVDDISSNGDVASAGDVVSEVASNSAASSDVASAGDIVSEVSSTADVVSDVASSGVNDVNGGVSTGYDVRRSDVTSTDCPVPKDIQATSRKTGSITEEWEVIKTPEPVGQGGNGEDKINITAIPLQESEYDEPQEAIEECLTSDSQDEKPDTGCNNGEGIEGALSDENIEQNDTKLQDTDEEFLDAVEDDSELLPDEGTAKNDDTTGFQKPNIQSESNGASLGSQEATNPLECVKNNGEAVENLHEE
ncbi:maternal protein tudor-like isoform X2 [Anneissia japonica]|uniref:maternal protein tudor-like isoform X2 n=1 Tax=Anneissia japonica TaxID=1529436 RepID=UPI0014259629|nr:maternal protein tudor-like isoform X2 [Anneissia japonica]